MNQHLISLFEGNPAFLKKSRLAVQAALLTTVNKLGIGRLKLKQSQPLGPIIFRLKNQRVPDQHLRQEKLEQAYKTKASLEQKLIVLNRSLQSLSFENKPQRLDSRATRKLQQSLTAQSEQFTYKLMEEQRQRKRRLQINRQKQQRKIRQEENQIESQKAKLDQQKLQQKISKLEQSRQKSLERKKRLFQINQSLQFPIIRPKPGYLKAQQEYQQKVLLPELQQRKTRLAQIREIFSPIDYKTINQHSQNYDQYIKQQEKQRKITLNANMINQSVKVTKLQKSVLQQDKSAIKSLQKKNKERKQLKERQKKYGDIVRQVFTPVVDKLKQQEMILIKQRLKQPVRKKVFVSSPSAAPYRPRLLKASMPPKEKSMRVLSEQRDYLSDRRRIRFRLQQRLISNAPRDLSDPKQAQSLESQANRQELILKRITQNQNNQPKIVEAEGNINEMLLASVKAKISLLSNNDN